MIILRWGLPAVLCLAGLIALVVIKDTGVKIEIWAMPPAADCLC